ncbi:Rieske 2Fe-2S domain-containing protein [Streptomyces griseus]|uniref:Rieske 2Fe-2S domain-containing protein n=1 Tax=Streptomyces griseus TaxID=1911 RepID=UPI00380BA1C7
MPRPGARTPWSPTEGSDSPGAVAGRGERRWPRPREVPEGGGAALAARKVVVPRPQPGEFKAFPSECTHQGCAVEDVSGGTIICPRLSACSTPPRAVRPAGPPANR